MVEGIDRVSIVLNQHGHVTVTLSHDHTTSIARLRCPVPSFTLCTGLVLCQNSAQLYFAHQLSFSLSFLICQPRPSSVGFRSRCSIYLNRFLFSIKEYYIFSFSFRHSRAPRFISNSTLSGYSLLCGTLVQGAEWEGNEITQPSRIKQLIVTHVCVQSDGIDG